MPDSLSTAFIATGSAIISSLITILSTSKLQHYFWKHQKRTDLRLEVIKEFNRLTAEFIESHTAAPTTYKPSPQWFTGFSILESNIRALFSQETFATFKQLQILIGPAVHGGLGPQGQYHVHDFVDRKDATMRQLYKELSLL